MTQDPHDQQLLEVAFGAGSAGRHRADREEAKLAAKGREAPTPEELETLSADMIGIDDPVRMYLREIGRVALLTAEEEVVLAQGDRARRVARRGALEGDDLAPRVDHP